MEKEAVHMCEKNKELLIDFIARASAFPNAHNYTAFINALKLFTGHHVCMCVCMYVCT